MPSPPAPDSLTLLASDWYWVQDADYRYTQVLVPGHTSRWKPGAHIGLRRWELAGVRALNTTWEQHRADLEARQPFHDLQYVMQSAFDGLPRYMTCSGVPCFDADGSFTGYRGTSRDITAQWLGRQKLQDAQRVLKMATRLARFGGWVVQLEPEECLWSDEVCAIHERPSGTRVSLAESIGRYVPEHQPAIRAAFLRCAREGVPYDLELQIVTAGGRRLWVRTMAEAERDAQGRIVRVQGAFQDIDASRRLADERQRLAGKLGEMNAQLEERVQRRTAQLQATTRELEALSYAIAHDVRAPLAAIQGFGDALEEREGAALSDKGRRYLRKIREAARKMDAMTAGILRLAQISREPPARRTVDLSALAADAWRTIAAQDPQRWVQVRIEPGLQACGDAVQLALALQNLLANAWKFTARIDPARVEVVAARSEPGEAAFCVRDNGVGFDPGYGERLFMPFHRLHAAEEFPGTGLGLAIVQKVVHVHGGRVWAESMPGKGASFFFALPAAG